jgi:transketolase
VYSWTHDSVGLGEDGPTHQPIEQLAAMRAMPGLRVIRPADANETAQAWLVAVGGAGPTALILSRQDVPVLEGTDRPGRLALGAYVLVEADGRPDLVLIATGSEVSVCVAAAELLVAEGRSVRVVSMPSWELFAEQDESYRASVLPDEVPTLAVEAAAAFGWERHADASVSIDRFGASAPGAVALERFGFTAANVADRARDLLGD